MTKDIFLENLLALGGKKSKKNNNEFFFLAPQLLIRHKPTKIEYTVLKVSLDKNQAPCVYCYRYYGKDGSKKVFIKINDKNFKFYEPV